MKQLKVINACVEDEVHAKFKILAIQEYNTMGAVLRRVVENYVAENFKGEISDGRSLDKN